MRVDVLVLGAGIAGLGSALALQARGRTVAIVDRRGPAEETSYGNAGLIQSDAFEPATFPRDVRVVLSALFDWRTDARVHLSKLPKTLRFLASYAAHSGAAARTQTVEANRLILEHVVADHRALAEAAGAMHLWREDGYLRFYRTAAKLEADIAAAEAVDAQYGMPFEAWDPSRLRIEEPHLSHDLVGAIHHARPTRVVDPGGLGTAYAGLFERRGGTVVRGDATTLSRTAGGFRLQSETGPVEASDCVVALGPWSGALLKMFGVSVPLGTKRGYHMHYASKGNAVLNHAAVDIERGYLIGPNVRGLRITSGAEFAPIDAPHTPVLLDRAERAAREVFPLAERLEPVAWRGARPCLPDLVPMIGPVPGVPGLWANFGHQHLGLTMGPTTGRLLAEMMAGETPFADPAFYRVERFG